MVEFLQVLKLIPVQLLVIVLYGRMPRRMIRIHTTALYYVTF